MRPWHWENESGQCPACGRRAALHAGRVPDFLVSPQPDTQAIWAWPSDFIGRAEPWLQALRAGQAVPPDGLAELQAHGLADGGGRMTGLGNDVGYHLDEYRVQGEKAQAVPDHFVESLLPGDCVLDVGGGAGQTLRRLNAPDSVGLVDVDVDLLALALGCRLADRDGRPIHFVRASAHALPFRAEHFSHLICRVALGLMHQARAVREMARVVRPGGLLYFQLDSLGCGLRSVRTARGKAALCRLRDVVIGSVLALTGWQPTPGSRFRGGMIFSTARRLKKVLDRAGCDVVESQETFRYLGLPHGFKLLARRR